MLILYAKIQCHIFKFNEGSRIGVCDCGSDKNVLTKCVLSKQKIHFQTAFVVGLCENKSSRYTPRWKGGASL